MILKIKSLSLLWDERQKRRREWHRWFVWYPMRANAREVIWLQKVYRRTNYYGDKWEFSLNDPLKAENA